MQSRSSQFSTPGSSQYNSPTGPSSDKKYNCYKCGYKTDRINVIIIHLKQHSASGYGSSPIFSKYSPNSSYNSNYQTPTRVSGISRTSQLTQDESQNTPKMANKEPKRALSAKGKMSPGINPKGKKRGRSTKKTDISAKKIKSSEHEIKSKLLADWSDDQDSEMEDTDKEKTADTSMSEDDNKLSTSVVEPDKDVSNLSINENEQETAVSETDVSESAKSKDDASISVSKDKNESTDPIMDISLSNNKDDTSMPVENDSKSRTNSVEKSEDESKSKSCFDFEEDDVIDVPKSPGRKIPRLITKKTRKEFEYTPEPADISSSDKKQDSIKPVVSDTVEHTKLLDSKEQNDSNNLELDIDDILNKTKLPELPEVPQDKFVDVEVKQKPLREIMSPKERGKRIFKSKQIFKTRMQEKYGSDIKPIDDNDIVLDDVSKDNLNLSGDKATENETDSMNKEEDIENNLNNDIKEITEADLKAAISTKSDFSSNAMHEGQLSVIDPIGSEIDPVVSEIDSVVTKIDTVVTKIDDTDSIKESNLHPEETKLPKLSDTNNEKNENDDITIKNTGDVLPDEIQNEESISLYSITNSSLHSNDIAEPKQILKKRKSRSSTGESIPKSPRIDKPPQIIQESDKTFNVIENAVIEESSKIGDDTLQTSIKEDKIISNDSDILNDKDTNKNDKSISAINVAECLINFSESAHSENIDESTVSPAKNKTTTHNTTLLTKSPTLPEQKVPQLGLGAIDASEPLNIEKNNKIENIDDKKCETNNVDKLHVEVEEKKLEVPDIQSYITGRSQTPETIFKAPMKSRLHNILTESPCSSVSNSSKDIIKNSSSKVKHNKVSDICANPKKQFVIKMKNEKSAATNQSDFKSAIDQIEDIETFVIEKPKPSIHRDPVNEMPKQMKSELRILKKGTKKPAIITSKKHVPIKNVAQDDSVFDINSMPIVLSDEIITNDNLDQMQLVLPENVDESSMIIDNNIIIMDKSHEIVNKMEQKTHVPKMTPKMQILRKVENSKSMLIQKAASSSPNSALLAKNQRVYQSPTKTKILKQNPTVITQPGKPGKFIVIPSSSSPAGSKYTVGKRLQQKSIIVKTTTSNSSQVGSNEVVSPPGKPIIQKVVHQKVNVDSSGNTVLFITNSNGEQSKVVLTADQKMKSSVTPQTIVTSKGAIINPKNSSAIVTTSKPSQLLLTSKGQIISRTNLQNTAKLAPATMKQKIPSNVGHTMLTSKGSLVTTSKLISSSGQIIQPNQLIMNKGKVLSSLSPNQIKKTGATKIIVNKKTNNQPHTLIKDVNQITKNILPERTKPQVHKKGFVKLSTQQLAEMEKLGFVTETAHGKIITPEGIKHMQTMTQDIKIEHHPHQKKIIKPNTTLKKIGPLPNVTENAQLIQKKKTIIINKQPAMPPLTPIDAKSVASQEALYQTNIDMPTSSDVEHSDNSDTHSISQTQEQLSSANVSESDASTTLPQEPALTALPDAQLLAVPGETFNGPLGSFFLCSVEENGNLTPIDNQPLYLDANNQLVPAANVQDNVLANMSEENTLTEQIAVSPADATAVTPAQIDVPLEGLENQQIIINADGQQFILDQQSLLALSEQQILTTDGQQLILQGNAQQILAALAGNQEVNTLDENVLTVNENVSYQHEFGNKDILATALANTNVFQNDGTNPDLDIYQNIQQNDYKHSTVSETSTALQQPIMSPLELPSKKAEDSEKIEEINFNQNIDDSLAVIGVNSTNIPTSLDLPITITNPEIAPKSTNPLHMACEMLYQTTSYSPVTSKELASSDIFQTPDVPMSHESLVHNSDISANLSMPELNSDCKDEELNEPESSNTTFSNESMPLLNDNENSQLEVDIDSNKNMQVETEASTKNETVEESKVVDTTCPPAEIELENNLIEKNSNELENKNIIEDSMEIENNCTMEKDHETKTQEPIDKMEINNENNIFPETIIENQNVSNVDVQDSPATVLESTTHTQVDVKESSVTELSEDCNLDKNTIESNQNLSPTNMVVSTETEISKVDDTSNSEINIITEGLHFGSEPSDLLTPSTIPETIVSPRSPCEVPNDFCESSNSCEIPIQPNLRYNKDEENIDELINDNNANDIDGMKKDKEQLKNNTDKTAEENNDFDMR